MTDPSTPSPTMVALRAARTRWLLVALAILGLLGAIGALAWHSRDVSLDIRGVGDEALLGPGRTKDLAVRVVPRGVEPSHVHVRLDGDRARVQRRHGALVLRPRALADGSHTLRAATPSGGLLGSATSVTRTFTVDTTPPRLEIDRSVRATSLRDRVVIEGRVRGAQQVEAHGADEVTRDGRRFRVAYDHPPAEAHLHATDAAGNTREARVSITVRHPGMRAVHLTASAWASDALRRPVLRMARQGRIDAVELDVKDESGVVGYDSRVPLARRTGAAHGIYDARQAVRTLHRLGVRVVGRLVCFHDPALASWAWRHGHREQVIQEADGGPWSGGYGDYAFTSFADRTVRQYNVDLAAEAAGLGFDDVLYDYVRRPDGDFSSMRVPGLHGSAPASIASFMAESRRAVRPAGAFLGASVFGIAASRPEQVAQDVTAMARHADYIAPMVYPSHWGPGEYGVANPDHQPYAITRRSLADFHRAVKGTNARIIPWLQDFSLGETYGPAQVRAQINAARAVGSPGFLLWNASARYHAGALDPRHGG